MTGRLPAAVRDAIGGPSATVLESVPPGMSGGRVYRCVHPSGAHLAVKRWPGGTSPTRVDEAHRVMRFARGAGCRIVPAVPAVGVSGSVFQDGDEVWDVVEWMPGKPLGADASPEAVGTGAAAIAEFHRGVRPLVERVEVPLAVRSRQERLHQLRDLIPRLLSRPAPSESSLDPLAQRRDGSADAADRLNRSLLARSLTEGRELLRQSWDDVAVRIGTVFGPTRVARHRVQTALRDVHRDHVLFADHAVCGLIDFDAVRVDTPATDLARWACRFLVTEPRSDGGRYDEVWNAALAGYRRVSPFSESEARLASQILFASAWMSLANWVVWLGLEQRRFPVGFDVLAGRVDELIRTARLFGDRDLSGIDIS